MAGLRIGDPASFIGDGYVGDPPDYAGFPVIVSQNKGADAVGSPYSVALPPGFQTGDRLFVLIKSETVDNEYTFPARWTKVFRKWEATLTVDVNLALYELIVDGSADASETSPITVSIASGGVATWLTFCVRGAHASAASEAGVATFSNASTTPDPPNLAPSWGTEKTLWIAVEGGSSGGTFTTAFPLPNFNERSNDASGGRVSAASIRDEVSSKNPGAFTLDSSVRWIANTVAVRPAAAAADDRIGQQCVGEVSPFEQEMGVEQGVQSAPLEDAAAADDDVTDAWIGDPEEFEAFDIASFMQARAPPDGEEEDIVPSSSVSDVLVSDEETTDDGTQAAPLEDEEVVDASILGTHIGDALDAFTGESADGFTAEPPTDDGDETGETTGAALVSDALDAESGVHADTLLAPPDEETCVFPATIDSTSGSEATATTSHTVTLPTGIVAGQLLLVLIGGENPSGTSFPAGWTELFDAGGSSAGWLAGAWRVADGGESGSITVTTTGSVKSAWIVYRFSNHNGTVEAATPVDQPGTASPDPPSLSPSWGSDKTKWLVAFAGESPSQRAVSAYPTDYADDQLTAGTGNTAGADATIGAASRLLETATEDPGAFSLGGTGNWFAVTIAVQGSCPNDQTTAAREVGRALDEIESIDGSTLGPLHDAPPDEERAGSEVGDALAGDEFVDGFASEPLHDFPPDGERVTALADGPEDFSTPFDEGLAAWPLADEEPVVGPQPGPVSVGVGAGWWIGGKRPKREAKWPDLPKPPATPPWKLKVVQPRDARLRIAAQERNWKTKMRRARREEDMIVLSIIAALLSEGDDET